MPTNEYRSKVAARLRKQKTWDVYTDFGHCIMDLCDAIFHDEGDLNDMFRLQSALADLIEPEPDRLCEIEVITDDGERYIQCTCCGYKDDYDFYPAPNGWNYCPNCGAKVVE